MNIVEIINKKANGLSLTEQEINFFVQGVTRQDGSITDYQAASLLMAIRCQGMTIDETYYLTKAEIESGEVVDLKDVKGIKIDKHSTGGVGDKVTLILGPICVALGYKIAKLSSIGLGHTGGTVDKLSSINVNTVIDNNTALKNLDEVGMFVMAQTPQICPADKVLCSIRNASSTVQSLPLIVASVLSKKLALKTDYIFIDLKYGSGAFMDSKSKAIECAKLMKKILEKFKRKGVIHVTSMIQPLGRYIGNALEVKASMEFLQGNFTNIFVKNLIYGFVTDILVETGKAKNRESAYKMIDDVIKSGKAFECFKKWAIAQGSSSAIIESEIFHPTYKLEVKATKNGYVKYISAREIGIISALLGAGRLKKDDMVDSQAGIFLNAAYNDKVKVGDVIGTLYSSREIPLELAKRFQDNTKYSARKYPNVKPILKVVS